MRSCLAAPENEPASTTRIKASIAARRSILYLSASLSKIGGASIPKSEDDDHLAPSFARLHDAVRFMDLLEAEDPDWLDVEPTGCGVGGNLLQRHIGKRQSRGSEYEAAEKRQIAAARHLQQRVEVGDRIARRLMPVLGYIRRSCH